MPLYIIREDITRMEVDAIVSAGSAWKHKPNPVGGEEGSIHRKAGPGLLDALRRLGGIRTASATLTRAYNLRCRYIIHTAGPVWRGGHHGEELLLRSCYQESLKLAEKQGLESIAFPLISTGTYGYPKAEALNVATSVIREFLQEHDMTVYLVVYDRESFAVSNALFAGVKQFIDQHYVDERMFGRDPGREPRPEWERALEQRRRELAARRALLRQRLDEPAEELPVADAEPPRLNQDFFASREAEEVVFPTAPLHEPMASHEPLRQRREEPACPPPGAADRSDDPICRKAPEDMESLQEALAQMLRKLDEGFPQMLLRLIDERGLKDSECYRRANVDRKLFNKIKNTPGYTPKKPTVMAFCIALELNMEQTRELLSRAGYGMSRSNMFDVIVEFFITRRVYDVHTINQVLWHYDQLLLGSNEKLA